MKLNRLFLLLTCFVLLAACDNNEPVTPLATAVPPTESATLPATATPMATEAPDQPTDAPTATPAATASQTYTSEAGAYSLTYPGTAKLFENERPSADGVLSPAPDSISILDETSPGYLLTLAHFALEANTSLTDFVDSHSECVGVTAANGEPIALAGEPALFFPDVACGLVGSSYIYLVKGNMGYRFTLETTANYAAVAETVQPILDSFASTSEGFPAAQAARSALAQELEVNPDQIVISAVQSAEWPDSCLGVHHIDVLCAQVVTPGYIITAQVNSRYYQINTNESGSSLVRVPGAVPPIGGIALTQESGDQCTAVIFHPESGVQAGFCEAELTSYPNDTAETATQLNDLIAQYAPFYSQTPIGSLNFSGLGDTVADPTLQRQIAELIRFYTDIIISGRASAASQLAFSWNRTGGFAGFCDDLAVYTYGLALANSCQVEAPANGGQLWLASEQLAQLYDWVDTFGTFEFSQNDPPNVSDALSLSLLFQGNGQETAAAADQQAIADFAAAIFAQATGIESAAPSLPFKPHTLTGDAGEVVGAFLVALLEDETGQSSVIYLNQALQQQVSEGQTVSQLLGFTDSLSAYEYAVTDNGRGDDTAVVEATLNETNPVNVTFTLTRQDGQWYISQIDQ